jgi:crotonobetainyl-CoA:carnitine CoA-transferase CaiB-like acyl-CoA transferase
MRALYIRQATGEGSRVDISMFQSLVSWEVNPVMLAKSFGAEITRRGNTHEFFAPVSVYETKDGYVYIAVGNDRQWRAMTELPGFESLCSEERKVNAGRIADVQRLNEEMNEITKTRTTEELIGLLQSITVPISTVSTIEDVIEDPLVKDKMITAKDPRTGREVFLPPTPVITPYLESAGMQMSFPPRMGEHNGEIYSGILGYDVQKMDELKGAGVI